MIALGCWLAAGVAAAEPFGPTDLDAVYSDRARIHYRVTRSCLANLAKCLDEPALTSPCGLSDPITGDACYSGVHRFCAAKGHLSGFGVEDPTAPSTVDVTCVGAGTAALADVPFAELAAKHGQCTDATSSASCGVAIDRWCRAHLPWTLGFGPVERVLGGPPTKSQLPVDTAQIVCVETEVSQTFVAPLVPCLVGGSQTPVSSACRQAMDDHCQQQPGDLRGGIGFRERGVNVNFGCIERFEPWQPNSELPPSPALPVDVNAREWDPATPGTLVHNALAANRSTSFDGRIRVAFRENIGGINYMSFRVQTPEIFNAPLTQVQGDRRRRSFELFNWADYYGFDVPEHDANGDGIFHGSSGGAWEAKSTAICDPHQGTGDPVAENRQQSVPGRVSNPFACNSTGGTFGGGLDHDCYDLTIVSIYDNGPYDEIWGAPVRVVVTNPKQADLNGPPSPGMPRARVVHVKILGPPRQAPFPPGDPTNIFEPNITGDGRLMIINGPTGEISYAVMPESATPCDVTQWTAFKQLHEMHTDPDMADYGIARYPIRDHEGELLGTRKVIGAYPWIDRDGDTLMWMAASSPLYYVDSQDVAHEKFEIVSHPYDCEGDPDPPNFCSFVHLHPTDMAEVQASTDDADNRLGMSVLGLWTHGKMVTPDSRNNAADFGLENSKQQWRNVRLYSDAPEGTLVAGGTIRFSVSSTENQFFFNSRLRPDIPREVAWFVSTEHQTDEIAFDDFLDPMALVVSPMNPSIKPDPPGNIARFQDGFDYTGAYRGEGFKYPSHIANVATSVSEEVVQAASQPGIDYSDNVQWNIPPYGYLLGGARAEPIAAGGTKGRGLWLDGVDDRLEYLVPEQPAERVDEMADVEWLYTVAIDPRELNFRRRLWTLPDGSWLDVVSSRVLQLGSGNNAWTQTLTLPVDLELTVGRWSALAVISTAAPSLDVYLDGYLLATYTPSESVFRMQPGRITLGARFTGFAGWVDDFKVIAGVSSSQVDAPEVICNHARGTLVGLTPLDLLWARAGAYPDTSHQAIAARLPMSQQYVRYACERPIDDPIDGVDLADHDHYRCLGQTRRMDTASSPWCVRHSLLFPEGPLFFDLPRPDSLANSFCLSCHRDSHPSATMRATEALSPDFLVMHQDVRRQPMQNSPKIFGFIPAGLIDGEPSTDVVTPVDGIFLDQYTTPSSDDP